MKPQLLKNIFMKLVEIWGNYKYYRNVKIRLMKDI